MNDYSEVKFKITPASADVCDLLADALAAEGFESFVPEPDGSSMTAYVKAGTCNVDDAARRAVAEIPIPADISWDAILVEGRDWNAEWERNYFKPIVIGGNKCVVHSSFHKDVPQAEYDIVIDPKMAFGTGHHATTSQMAEALLALGSLEGTRLVDMGTGTGILAILAAMRGAEVRAVEIDEFAYENALENVRLNLPHASGGSVEIFLGDVSALEDAVEPGWADVFLANINRNVITADIGAYSRAMKKGAVMLLSGFYEADIPVVADAAAAVGIVADSHTTAGDGWACLKLHKE